MAQSQDTVREIFIADALASETTLKTFEASASNGELGIFMADGSDGDAADQFVVAVKLAGKTIVSDKYKASEIRNAIAKNTSPQLLRQIAVSPTVVTAGTEFIVNIRMSEWGSLSVNDYYMKHGQYEAVSGDDAGDIVDGLITSLNQNFSKEPLATATSNPYFTFTKGYTEGVLTVTDATSNGNATITLNGEAFTVALLAADDVDATAVKIAAAINGRTGFSASSSTDEVTVVASSGYVINSLTQAAGVTGSTGVFVGTDANGSLVITEKAQDLELGKKEGRPIAFDVMVDQVSGVAIADIATTVGGFPGVGTGRQVALMEYFYRGNRGDAFRDQHFPYNWNKVTKSAADPTATYGLVEVTAIRQQDEMFNTSNSRKQLTIAVPVDGGLTAVNAIINKMELVTGKTIPDLA